MLNFPWRNLTRVPSTRFWILLKALMTPEGIRNALAFHSMGPESFLSFCLPFDHFFGSCISCALFVLTAFNMADGDHQLALRLTSGSHQTHYSRTQCKQVAIKSRGCLCVSPTRTYSGEPSSVQASFLCMASPAVQRQEGGPSCLLHDGPVVPGLRLIVTEERVSSGSRW